MSRLGKLTDPWYEAKFLRTEEGPPRAYVYIDQLDGAQGIFLCCPCGQSNLMVMFANPHGIQPASDHFGMRLRGNHSAPPPRWQMSGTGLHDLTLSPSISVGDPECWHGFIQNGEVK